MGRLRADRSMRSVRNRSFRPQAALIRSSFGLICGAGPIVSDLATMVHWKPSERWLGETALDFFVHGFATIGSPRVPEGPPARL